MLLIYSLIPNCFQLVFTVINVLFDKLDRILTNFDNNTYAIY